MTSAGSEEARELLPCPWCGGEAVLGSISAGRAGMIQRVAYCRDENKCSVCPMTDGFDEAADAIAAWNTRANNVNADPYRSLQEILALAKEWGKNPEHYTQAEANIIGFAEDALTRATR